VLLTDVSRHMRMQRALPWSPLPALEVVVVDRIERPTPD
jgi:hypothetical protein